MTTRRHVLAGAAAIVAAAVLPSALSATDPDEACLLRHLTRYGFPADELARFLAAFRGGSQEFRWLALRMFEMTPAELDAVKAHLDARIAARNAPA